MPTEGACCANCGVEDVSTATLAPRSEAVKATIAKIMGYPFSQVREKILLEGSVPEGTVDEAIAEFRKFLCLFAMGYRGMGMTSREVDEVWHTFILFTKDYAQFCEQTLGVFLHHQPGIPSQPLGKEPRRRFIEAYRAEYGDIPEIWAKDGEQCFNTCTTPSTNCQDPPE